MPPCTHSREKYLVGRVQIGAVVYLGLPLIVDWGLSIYETYEIEMEL